jgi:hypothetical protein
VKLSFVPGDLHLSQENETYIVTHKNQEVIRTRSQRRAIDAFNKLRQEMQGQFPNQEATPEEMKASFQREIADSIVGHNSVRKHKR